MKRLTLFVSVICLFSAFINVNTTNAAAYSVSASNGAIMEFADVLVYFPSDWAAESVRLSERLGIGYRDRIEPYNRKLTRKELAYVAFNMFKVLEGGGPITLSPQDKAALSTQFKDVVINGTPLADEVFLAIRHNLMYGTSENMFSPDGYVTREQTAAVLGRIIDRYKNLSAIPQTDLSAYSDLDEISHYAYGHISALVSAGVITGVSADRLAPKNVCTYEEVLSIAVRLLKYYEAELGLELYSYSSSLLESPIVVNVHHTEINYQDKPTDILDAEWIARDGAIGYAIDCRKADGTVLRSLTTNTGVTVFEADIYDSIDVYSISAADSAGSAGLIGDMGASVMNPIAEDFTDYTGIYEYNDYARLLSVQAEDEYLFSTLSTDFTDSNPKNIELKRYSSNAEAMADMTEITVRIWKMGQNDTRVSGTASMYVHRAVAQDVIDIFEDIYNGPEQFPIYAVAGYNWRGAGSKSSHNQGLAIDINPDHNYFINTRGGILAGKMWNPSLSPYSIKPDGDVVRAFNKKGWFWGGIGWSTTGKDYMHFSYTGV